ncbi:MAG: signal peptide peptidase SppA [Nitrospirae bacterium]|uniref:signal peptide peptidase SppA n=1 Tax=Candidatus Magnetobacterium casense TaxID=1455061 RepID=UPI00058C939D|nr:signal peptide peptidase SppA [Candidatus Magnetobacterium casensis]MBF0338783.1 signal peptide peptidase SppA [Nitrospirota bacterium]
MKKVLLFFSAIFIIIAVISLILSLLTHRVVLGDKIALIKVEGIILSSTDTVKEIKKYRDDPAIKAIVLSVDSPGGAVVPSAEIYDEVRKTVKKKKVVVSMGSLAASGGYYISSPASKIIANQATITGSIGVIMEMANLSGLMDKIGIKSEVIKSGRYKDLASLYRGVGKEEREILQGVLDDIHGQFIEAVAEGRKMPFDRVSGIADGRIFTGKQALELGLIDKIGTLQDAIREAADMVGIKGEPQIVTKKDDFSLNELLSNKLGDLLPVSRAYPRINYRMMF